MTDHNHDHDHGDDRPDGGLNDIMSQLAQAISGGGRSGGDADPDGEKYRQVRDDLIDVLADDDDDDRLVGFAFVGIGAEGGVRQVYITNGDEMPLPFNGRYHPHREIQAQIDARLIEMAQPITMPIGEDDMRTLFGLDDEDDPDESDDEPDPDRDDDSDGSDAVSIEFED